MEITEITDAIKYLVDQARQDHGGAGRCAMFLLSLWDGGAYKADLQELIYNDPSSFTAMIVVLEWFYNKNQQLDQYVTQAQMDPIIAAWGNRFRVKAE